MTQNLEHGDVRIVTEHPELMAELLISEVVTAAALQERYPDLCAGYEEEAIVPDPDTLRVCTEEEKRRYVVSTQSVKDIHDPSLIVYIPPSDRRVDNYRKNPQDSLGLTECGPNMLTTTRSHKDKTIRPGLHYDAKFLYRIGVNYGPEDRRLVVVTHSARLLFPGVIMPTTGMVRERLAKKPLPCLHLMQEVGGLYIAHTGGEGAVAHDASRYGMSGTSWVGFHPVPHDD